jgi:hypothetical protein
LQERVAKSVATALSFGMIGSLAKFRPIEARTIAQAMLAVAAAPKSGVTVYEFEQMLAFSKPG